MARNIEQGLPNSSSISRFEAENGLKKYFISKINYVFSCADIGGVFQKIVAKVAFFVTSLLTTSCIPLFTYKRDVL